MNKNIFNSVQMSKPKNNLFDLSHDVKLSLNMGELVPIMVMETVPGDRFNISVESLLRFAPLVSPVMHRMNVTIHYFFVPNRILWDGWEDFITNTKTLGVLPAFPFNRIESDGSNYNKLLDYLGVPRPDQTTQNIFEDISAFPVNAYQKIYDEYYRDQNLQPSVYEKLVNGINVIPPLTEQLKKRAWGHDYLTSALPFAQKGDPVQLPIVFNDVDVFQNQNFVTPGTTQVNWPETELPGGAAKTGFIEPRLPDAAATSDLFANTSALAGSSTINDLRRAYALQRWLEKAARAGSRYFESILAIFGIKSPDSRLDRPEYITGTQSPVVISEVLNTTGDTGAVDPLPQGNMSGHAVSIMNSKNGSYFCQEHGYIMGIMSVIPMTAYQQGMPKHFTKTTDPTQFFTPDFANIGEQEILNKEVMAFSTIGSETFGYTPRYAEYKYESNRVAGEFRTNLDFWHLGRIFDPLVQPALNSEFITCVPDSRIFAVTDIDTQKLYAHVYNKIKATRPMPKYGTPTF
ncbi:major capsid protein [Antarctic microvirus COCH21_V_SP_16]|nr:major capsid protein [Antarctic microvirus COCH21_V_SP_16]